MPQGTSKDLVLDNNPVLEKNAGINSNIILNNFTNSQNIKNRSLKSMRPNPTNIFQASFIGKNTTIFCLIF